MMQALTNYEAFLREKERSSATIEKYTHALTDFIEWANTGVESITKELTLKWKAHLMESDYVAVTINCMLSALNGFLHFLGLDNCCVAFLKVQRRLFREETKELTRAEFHRLTKAAREKGDKKVELLLETICATGIRVSEVQYITVEAVEQGQTDIALKGKIRTILIPKKLRHKLKAFAQEQNISSGEIFLNTKGGSLSRSRIWDMMKRLCDEAGIEQSKVFPHNLRHLFARAFYKETHDIVQLADVLGHSSIETTRIYLITSYSEHAQLIDGLGFVT